jgi:hypothetical protein
VGLFIGYLGTSTLGLYKNYFEKLTSKLNKKYFGYQILTKFSKFIKKYKN